MDTDQLIAQTPVEEMDIPEVLPLVPLRGTVVFPHVLMPLVVGRDSSVKALDAAYESHRMVLLVAQKEASKDGVSPGDLYSVGTVAVIEQMLKLPNGTAQILVQGKVRARIIEFADTQPFFSAKVYALPEISEKTVEVDALMRSVLSQFENYVNLSRSMPPEVGVLARNVEDPHRLVDLIGSSVELAVEQRQQLLEAIEAPDRLRILSVFLSKELEVLELKSKIQGEVQREMEKTQKEYFLREQMKAIQRELGEMEPQLAEASELRDRIQSLGMPEDVEKRALKEVDRLEALPAASPEVGIIRTYVDWLISLPWSVETEDNTDLKRAAQILNEDHYGLEKVKERILEFMAVRKLAGPNMRTPIICFVGPPGVGKTSLGKSIARALGRKFVRMSLGGIRDEAEIRGHRRTYVGALPGRIVQGVRNAGTRNPVFMLDEIDKVGMDFRGDPTAALLEVLDPEQNREFSDHYLELPFDMSHTIFITTANLLEPIPPPLRDRMEVIGIPGYTEYEKLRIAQQFLVPKELKANGLEDTALVFTDDALRTIIRNYTKEAGVRNLEREIAGVCRKVARKIAEGEPSPGSIDAADIPNYLGPVRFVSDAAELEDEIGAAMGVAWTETGGELIPVEVTLIQGKGDFILTGQLGQVMQESARAALSYARSRSEKLGIDPKFFDDHFAHLHVPAGAIPKDGPSAGITMATALVSALTKRPVRKDVAMTGEITLRGRVLPIGGLKEKVLAAHRGGIRTFILPAQNEKDLVDIPEEIKRDVTFIAADHVDEVLRVALKDQVIEEEKTHDHAHVISPDKIAARAAE